MTAGPRTFGLAAYALLAAFLLAVTAAPALAATGQISGEISNGSVGVPGEVEIYEFEEPVLKVATASNGTYTASGLEEGTEYEVGFFPQGNYLFQYYNDSATFAGATTVAVKGGVTTSGIDALVQPEAQISGKVSDSLGADLEDVDVFAYTPSGEFVGLAFTGEGGAYTITGLYAGSYVLEFERYAIGGEQVQYYKDKASRATAEQVAVTAGATVTGIDETLPALGQITGTVSGAGQGLEGASVELLSGESKVDAVDTTTGGAYTIREVLPGAYKVRFVPPEHSDYLPQYYNGADAAAQATTVNVATGATTGSIDAALPAAGEIAGTVSDTLGAGMTGIEVDLFNAGHALIADTTTGAGGSYALPGLQSGSYLLEFFDSSYATTYYSDKTTLASAEGVAVSAGSVTAGIDARMPPAADVTGAGGSSATGEITGVVTEPGGAGVKGAIVVVFDRHGHALGQATTAANGTYTFDKLPTGDYQVQFESGPEQSFAPQYDNGSVSVVEGAVTYDVDAQLHAGGTIAGVVQDGAGGAVGGIEVSVYSAGGLAPEEVGSTVTAADGSYSVGGLASGDYLVRFANAFEPAVSWVTQFYSGQATLATATPVAVTEGSTASGVDAALASGGTISGTVSDSSSAPVVGVRVEVLDSGGHYVSSAVSEAGGSWSVGNLAAGSYLVRFVPAGENLLGEYYPASATQAGAHAVTVAAGVATAGIDAQLPAGSEISGTDSLGFSSVTVLDTSGNRVTSVQANGGGEYEVLGLPAGSYVVRFEPLSYQNYLPQYYNAASTFASATAVSTSPAAPATGIDATFEEGAKIAGVVSDETGHAIPGVEVLAYGAGEAVAASATTISSGAYTLVGLPAGSYRLEFRPEPGVDYLTGYYKQQSSLATATAVALTTRQSVTGIDATLAPGGSIEGTVADEAGSGVGGVEAIVLGASGEALAQSATAADGDYMVSGLAAGSYRVEFEPAGVGELSEFYPNVLSLFEAQAVNVTAGAATSGIDAKIQSLDAAAPGSGPGSGFGSSPSVTPPESPSATAGAGASAGPSTSSPNAAAHHSGGGGTVAPKGRRHSKRRRHSKGRRHAKRRRHSKRQRHPKRASERPRGASRGAGRGRRAR
jgi:hypothetical protein